MTPTQIKKLRGQMTQAQFGKLIGLSARTIMRWENGQKKPSKTQMLFLKHLSKTQ